METDVLVVGAGPVGLYLARLLEGSGLTVRILEEHERIGRPNHCSGLVSRNMDLFVRPSREWIEHEVSGAIIRAGSSELRLGKTGTAAYVIDRARFDSSLASELSSHIVLGAKAEAISLKDGVSIKTDKGTFRSRMLLGCDGTNSAVAKHFSSRPRKLLMGVIGIIKGEDYSENVEIIIDKKASKDGFFWRIPRGQSTEYGMFSSKADFLELERFFGIKPAERRAGLIPLGPGKTCFERTLLVGDAAGMSKPWSGGGIIYGLTAARIAAETVCEAFNQNDFSGDFLARYESRWRREFGRQIQIGMFARRVFENMGDFETRIVLKKLGVLSLFLNRMDMDFLVR